MKELKELFDISEQIFKIQKAKTTKNNSIYDELISDLAKKEKKVIEKLEIIYNYFINLINFIKKYFNYDFNEFFAISYIQMENTQPITLHVFGLIQSIWEHFNFQDFSVLSPKQISNLYNNIYFQNYQETMQCFNDWKYVIYQEYLNLLNASTPLELHSVSFLNDYGQKELTMGFNGSEAYKKALEIETNYIIDIYLNLIRKGNVDSNYNKKKLLFEACLKNIPAYYLSLLREKIVEELSNIKKKFIDNEKFNEINAILKLQNIAPINLLEAKINEKEDKIRDSFEFYKDDDFTYEEIRKFDEVLEKLFEIDTKIFNIYTNLIKEVYVFKNKFNQRKYKYFLFNYFAKERELYNSIDILRFKDYVSKKYEVKEDFYPFSILHLFPNGIVSHDCLNNLIIQRILFYELTFEELTFNNIICLDLDLLLNQNNRDLDQIIFWNNMYNLGLINKEQLLIEHKRSSFDFSKMYEQIKNNYITILYDMITISFIDKLIKNGFDYLMMFYFFVNNNEMTELVKNDFKYSFANPENYIPPFYDMAKEIITDEFNLVLEDYKNETDKLSKFFIYLFLESCCNYLKEEDQIELKELFFKCEEEVKLKRKKD